jgi:hypothetical protein
VTSQKTIQAAAWVGFAAQVLFTVAWLLAQLWQPPAYRPLAHTISDMYAFGAPYAGVLLVCLPVAGAGTIVFAVSGLRPVVAGHWTGTVGWVLVAVSILGLGDLLAFIERLGCELAAPGCTVEAQLANLGGILDSNLSGLGLLALVAAGFFLAETVRRRRGLEWVAWPCRIGGVLTLALLVFDGVLSGADLGGLGERLIAFVVAAEVALLAVLVARVAKSMPVANATTMARDIH